MAQHNDLRMDNLNIEKNIAATLQRISNACKSCGRDPNEVRLVMATKTVPAARIKMALATGQLYIAENKVQELKEKYEELKDTPHISHFIGHLQTNKIKEVIRHGVQCIESVDRLRLAEKLDQRLSFEEKQIEVLIQVNTSGEQSKFGVHPDDAIELVRSVSALKTIRVKGLMTIGLFSAETEKVRRCFRLLRTLRDDIRRLNIEGVDMYELSMGMSGDLEAAIEEGATIVRVGTAIFGKREYPDSYYWNEGR